MIPIYGSFARPGNREEGVQELINARVPWGKGNLTITAKSDEFTAVCPTTGQPDYYTVEIKYIPDQFYIESKSLKFYLWSFRDLGYHCETLSKQIADDIITAISPKYVKVTLHQKIRGGIELTAEYEIKLEVNK
ncbi:MAG TPA: preQ(1) synthase [Ignavibacteriales bacterium]|nr:preQ(1) synthase [Ignavibacteriales bacterium]